MEANTDSVSEAREVLSKYLELFHQNTIDFKYNLAPNSVIDWYGRSVRGAIKIHDYLRHEVLDQFDHVGFLDPEICAPIETKTSHMRTKIITAKSVDTVHPINRLPDMVPLKTYADSDVEDNEQPITSRFAGAGHLSTPEKCISTLPIQDLTPPASVKKDELGSKTIDSADEEVSEKEIRKSCKKRNHSGSFSYLKRLPTAPSTSKRRRDSDGIRTLLDDTSSEEDEFETMEVLYTPLRYLEVNGKMIVKPSWAGKAKSALWRDRNELETRIRISYRRSLQDQQLQFALIIYESRCGATVGSLMRRNLSSQFATSVAEAPQNVDNEQSEQLVQETVLETTSTMISIPPTTTTTFGDNEDPLQDEISMLESLTAAQMRTPTKFTHTPPATPKRKPRSLLASTSGLKRLNSTPSAPTPKRSAARSLRL